MPMRPARACRKANCSGVASSGNYYCDKHKALTNSWLHYTQGINSDKRGYGHRWRKLRKRILQRDHYLCQKHLADRKFVTGNIVDHIIPRAHGGSDSEYNLQTLCSDCHKAKTATEKNRKHIACYG